MLSLLEFEKRNSGSGRKGTGKRMTAEIFLLRHGETAWNAEHRLQGHKDSPLTSRGREQARIVGRILSKYFGRRHQTPMAVSPLGRARATKAYADEVRGGVYPQVDGRHTQVTRAAVVPLN